MFKKLLAMSLICTSLIGCGSSTSITTLAVKVSKQWSCSKTSNSITFQYTGIVYSNGNLATTCKVSSGGSEASSSGTQIAILETDATAFYCSVTMLDNSYWRFVAPSGVKTSTKNDNTTVTFASSDCS